MYKYIILCTYVIFKQKLPPCCQMPNILPGLDNAWEKCFEMYKQFKDKPETKEYKEMAHGKGD